MRSSRINLPTVYFLAGVSVGPSGRLALSLYALRALSEPSAPGNGLYYGVYLSGRRIYGLAALALFRREIRPFSGTLSFEFVAVWPV